MLKLLIVVTSASTYADHKLKTGLWLSELTHIYHNAIENGYDITIASPNGGDTPIDPESLKPLVLDHISKGYWNNTNFRDLLQHAKSLQELADQEFDGVYLAGGHGTMYDFPDNVLLQHIIKNHYEKNKIVAAICHGVGGLLNVKLSNGEYMIKAKILTGFSWLEESLARRKKKVPFNLEAALKARGADYKKAFIPMTSKVLTDGKLITGQNPFSSKEMAKVVIEELKKFHK
ncbi:type 1 glutamine amidotransferase domain-containing protein [Pedobacter sp.]|uniref:type 1 glutamine amidotransferase domain-containing protein n=1 Tax=Pedobacter sp. TaxID=1411316 RepID=UPI00396CBF64